MNENKNPINIIILGLENAGKSTLLYRIAGKGFIPTFTTIGLNAEIIRKDDLTFQAIDIGGQKQFRETLWPHYTTMHTAGRRFCGPAIAICPCTLDR